MSNTVVDVFCENYVLVDWDAHALWIAGHGVTEAVAIMREKGITHAFTWPLAKMKERFVAMNWLVIPKGQTGNPHYGTLYKVVGSIYGTRTKLSNYILGTQFRGWDFVMRVVA